MHKLNTVTNSNSVVLLQESAQKWLYVAKLNRLWHSVTDKLISIENAVITILGAEGSNWGIKWFSFFVPMKLHYKPTGFSTVIQEPSHWKYIMGYFQWEGSCITVENPVGL